MRGQTFWPSTFIRRLFIRIIVLILIALVFVGSAAMCGGPESAFQFWHMASVFGSAAVRDRPESGKGMHGHTHSMQ